MSTEIPKGFRAATKKEAEANHGRHCEVCAQAKVKGSLREMEYTPYSLCAIEGKNDCFEVGYFVKVSE